MKQELPLDHRKYILIIEVDVCESILDSLTFLIFIKYLLCCIATKKLSLICCKEAIIIYRGQSHYLVLVPSLNEQNLSWEQILKRTEYLKVFKIYKANEQSCFKAILRTKSFFAFW